MNDDIVYSNDKEAVLDLCLRNAIRYARGEIKYTRTLHDQLRYAYENCNENTRSIMRTIFDIVEFDA